METKKIGHEVEETLGILKKNQRQESNPYTYNKVIMKLNRNGKEKTERKYSVVIKYSLLALIVILNLITIIKFNILNEVQQTDKQSKAEILKNLETIANEYNLFINY